MPKDNKTKDLFELYELTELETCSGSMDYRKEVSLLFSRIVDEFNGDRFELASRVSRLTGINISKQMIDGYTAEGRKKFNVPFWLIVAVEEAAETRLFTQWLVKHRQGRVFFGKDVIKAQIGTLEIRRQKTEQKIRKLTKGMET